MSHAASTGQYKYDLHILCNEPEPKEVEALRLHLESYKIYGNNDLLLGRSVFDAVGEGIDQSSYTMLWVSKEDLEAGQLPSYFRQNTLARLVEADPKPKGTERILIALNGVSDEDFKKGYPEFKQFITLPVHPDSDWKEKIETVLIEKEVFSRDYKQTNQRNLTDDQLRHAADCAADPAACADAVEKYVRSTHPSNDHRPTLNREDSGCSTATDSFQCSEMALSLSRESLPQAALDGTRFSYNSGMIPTPGNLAVMDWNSTQVPCQQQDHEESSPPAVLEQMKTQREQMKTQREQIQELEGTIKQMEKERAMEKEQQEKEQALEKEQRDRAMEEIREQVSRLLQHHSEVDSVQVSSIVQNNEIVLCNNTMKKPEDLKEMPDQSNEGNKGILPAVKYAVVGFVQNVCNTFLTG